VALIAAVFVAYAPALGGDLVWDDAAHVTRGALQGWDGLWRIWFEPGATQQYYPVLHTAFWVEHRLWGDATVGYHAANALWHAIASLLTVLLGQHLGVRGAWVAGFLFAVHPVHVESVAWISEQKNTLSLVFALAAALRWTRFDASRQPRDWAEGLGWFLLALGTKSVTAVVPCALLVVAWWRRGRVAWRTDVAPLIPWIVLGAAAGLGTAWVERHFIGANGAEVGLSAIERPLLAARAVWHYLTTFLWPSSLVFTYPRWDIRANELTAYAYPVAALALTYAWWRVRAWSRAPLAAWLAFAGMLFPALGFVDVYPFRYAFVADHFQYHANVALALAFGGAMAWSRRALLGDASRPQPAGTRRRLIDVGLTTLFLTLVVLTWRQAGHYTDAETLYRATLARNPSSWMAHHNLGRIVSRKSGGLEEAIAHFRMAIALKPDHARAHYSLGVALQRAGRGATAVPHFEAAIRLEPNNAPVVANAEFLLGQEALARPDGAADAVRHFERALRLKPGIAETEAALAEARRRAAARPVPARRDAEQR
jgi:tetratricopeptide (TPR) repeat protein